MAKALIVEILADAKQFGHELDRAAGKTRQLSKVAGVAGLAIAGGLAYGLEKSVKAAMAAQTSQAKLATAFKASHDDLSKYTGAIDDAESAGRNLGFSNVDIRDSLGSLEIATHDGTKAIRDLGIAEDIARFKHIGLTDASKVLTMAMAGSQRATKQLGLSLQPVTTAEDKVKRAFKDHTTTAYAAALATAKLDDKQATAAQVIDLVSQKLHGQAQAFSDTAAGAMARFHAQVEAIQENLGAALLPAITSVTSALATLTGWLSQHATVTKIAVAATAALSAALLTASLYLKATTEGTALNVVVTKAAEAATKAFAVAQWLLNAALDANPIGIVVIAIAALVGAFIVAWEHSQTFRNIVLGVWAGVKGATRAFVDFFKPVVVGAIDAAVSGFNTMKKVASHLWDGVKAIWDSTIGAEIKAIIHLIQTLIRWAEKAAHIIGALANAAGHVHVPGTGKGGGFSVPIPGTPFGVPVPGFASGGIVTRPTLAVVGEAGPEAIVPLGSRGMGGTTVNVTVNGWVGTDQQIAYKIRDELVRIARREPNALAGFA